MTPLQERDRNRKGKGKQASQSRNEAIQRFADPWIKCYVWFIVSCFATNLIQNTTSTTPAHPQCSMLTCAQYRISNTSIRMQSCNRSSSHECWHLTSNPWGWIRLRRRNFYIHLDICFDSQIMGEREGGECLGRISQPLLPQFDKAQDRTGQARSGLVQ